MGQRILVVDDDGAIRRLVTSVLRRARYETDEAADGREAIEKLTAGEYAAIFLDLMMPVCNGFEVIAFLRTRDDFRKCVVVMTAAGTRGTDLIDYTVVDRVIHKPFEITEIVESAEACIERQRDPS